MIEDKLRAYLEPNLGHAKKTRQGIKFNCPVCDKGNKFNLEVNLDPNSIHYKKFNCWGCPLKGTVRTLLKSYAVGEWRGEPEFKVEYSDSYLPIEQQEKMADLPEGTMPYYLKKEVKEYLINTRGLDEKVLIERNIMYCFSKQDKLYNHIIFPFYEKGNLIGYSSQNFETKKYRNHRKLNFIAYKEFINWDFPVILTEGIYDALSVPNAIPILGTILSTTLLREVKDKKIILAMDNDKEMSPEYKKQIQDKLQEEWDARLVTVFDVGEYKDLNEFYIKDKSLLKEKLLIPFELLNFA